MTATVTRALAVGGLCLAVAAITVGGSAVPTREPSAGPPVEPDGRTVTLCPVAPTVAVSSGTAWGELGTRTLRQDQLQPVPANRGVTLTGVADPVVLVAEGRQNLASAASAYARHGGGPDRGVALARCGTPATSSWFTGLVSNPDDPQAGVRSEIVLTNPDVRSAEVDLVVYGPSGLQTATGGRGIAVPARASRTVALETLFTRAEPVGVEVRANRGRVAAVARQHLAAGAQPAGTDWQVATAAPATDQIIPGVPAGAGARTLVLSNPGNRRTTATIEILGPGGTFAPADASMLDVNAESTASVPLQQGLEGEPGAVRIVADQPLVATAVARSSDDPRNTDIALQPATRPLSATGIGALAVTRDVTGTLLVTNDAESEVTVPVRIVAADGIELLSADLAVPAGGTASWPIAGIDQPAAVHVRAPAGSRLHAGIVLTSRANPEAGLATTPLSAPELQQREHDQPAYDPGAGR